jgi:hypothetical protein
MRGKLSRIQREILIALSDQGPMATTELRKAVGARFIGVNTLNFLRNKDCIISGADLKWFITDIGRTAAETGNTP